MPVQRFRDFEDARRALWIQSGDPRLVARIRSLWEFSARLVPRQIPRGVRKFSTIEEANQERDRWTESRVRSVRAQRLSTERESPNPHQEA